MLPLLSDLGALKDFWDFVRRIQEWLTLGGAALAGSIALLFLVTWTLSFVRRAQAKRKALLSTLALVAAYPAIGLTLVAAAGLFIPSLAPLILKSFALAALAAALSWCLAVASILRGGNAHDLARARRSLLLAGTPWYCLAIYLALHL
ncbi:MAG: hypothetical protein KC486_09310 [Myxococcales bacterium]|nr:hypothetical protein [Myxococcales bacterium]